MDQALRDNCQALLENSRAIQQVLKWEENCMYHTGGLLYLGGGQEVDPRRLKECDTLFKKMTGIFSALRNSLRPVLVCKMALAPDPAGYLARLQAHHKAVHYGDFFAAGYTVLTTMTVLDRVEDDGEALRYMIKAKNMLTQGMAKQHPVLTSDNDLPYAGLLVLTGRDQDDLVAEMETCYHLLKPQLPDSDGVQTLSHVLTLYDAPVQEKCQKAVRVYQVMKNWRHTYSPTDRYAALGAAAMLEGRTADQIADAIMDVDDLLEGQKGFNLDSGQRRMFAALLVLHTYLPRGDTGLQAGMAGAVSAAVAAAMATAAATAYHG